MQCWCGLVGAGGTGSSWHYRRAPARGGGAATVVAVGLLSRLRGLRGRSSSKGRSTAASAKEVRGQDSGHLAEFARTRVGVEAYVEPATNVTPTTILLIATDGEWTRRRVPSVKWAHDFANKHQVPSYDAAVVGIPQRMRDYNRRKKAGGI